MMVRPSCLAIDLLAIRTAAAPSVTWEAFPAVVVPFLASKAGLSFESASAVVALIPSSLSATIVCSLPSSPLTFTVIGVISAFRSPFF